MKLWEWLKRNIGINTPGFETYYAFGGGTETIAGVRVDHHNALMISTVYQCVRYISDQVSQLPLSLYREVKNGKEKALDHPLYRILQRAPNPLIPPSIFKKTLQSHLLLWGNAFAEIERNGAGQVIALWPLLPDMIRIQLFNGNLYYYYREQDGTERQITDMLHLRGLSNDGLLGYSPITLQRQKLGLVKASEEYRARFFNNDARPGGILTHPGTLQKEAKENIKKSWQEAYGGIGNRSRVAIFDQGMDWKDVGMPPKDAEFIAGEEFSKADIAAIFGVPPYKIGLMKPGTVSYASVEQQAIDADSDCLQPWLKCWEDCMNLTLLTPTEQQIYFVKFNMNALMRADSVSRADFYQKLFDRGVFTVNDILSLEDMNTIGPDGDRRFVPLNMVPLDRVDDVIDAKNEPKTGLPAAPNGAMQPKMLNGAAH